MDNSQLPQIPDGALGALLGNPQVVEKLPRIMEALGPVLAEMKSESTEGVKAPQNGANAPAPETEAPAGEPAAEDAAKIAKAVETAVARPLPREAKNGRQRAALLRALAPYLSDERRAALETILKMSSLLDVISEVL